MKNTIGDDDGIGSVDMQIIVPRWSKLCVRRTVGMQKSGKTTVGFKWTSTLNTQRPLSLLAYAYCGDAKVWKDDSGLETDFNTLYKKVPIIIRTENYVCAVLWGCKGLET